LEEIRRAAILGIPYVVMHPGSHVGEGEGKGIKRVVEALKRLHEKAGEVPVAILLETTAGQGTNLGYRFEHLAEMINIGIEDDWLGVCLDTCHVFTAGYDFRTEEKYNSMISDFDRIIGLDRLKLVHVNDSKKALGSRVDRHEHLGRGFIGRKAFSFFLSDTRLKDNPFIIETPKGKDENGVDWDVRNIDLLRHMMEKRGENDCD
jgi:deoxyribonuclease-4